LHELGAIAPLIAVRGNIDSGSVAKKLPDREVVELDPREAGYQAVIFGHSHRPSSETRHGVLYFNPGSAGPRRFRLPVTVGRLALDGGEIASEIVDIGREREMPAG